MSDMKFIRKGTGRPFSGGQFSRSDISKGALPGADVWTVHTNLRIMMCANGKDLYVQTRRPHQEYNDIAAGLDAQGRPSFLTVEVMGVSPQTGQNPFDFTNTCEWRIEKMNLAQSENYVNDLMQERYVAQWSLVTPAAGHLWKRTWAKYELSARYALTSYRSEGLMHLALGNELHFVLVS